MFAYLLMTSKSLRYPIVMQRISTNAIQEDGRLVVF